MSEGAAPPGIDVTKPSVARVYNFMIGGKDHYTVDRRFFHRFVGGAAVKE